MLYKRAFSNWSQMFQISFDKKKKICISAIHTNLFNSHQLYFPNLSAQRPISVVCLPPDSPVSLVTC